MSPMIYQISLRVISHIAFQVHYQTKLEDDQLLILPFGRPLNQESHLGRRRGVPVAQDGISNVRSWPALFSETTWMYTPGE